MVVESSSVDLMDSVNESEMEITSSPAEDFSEPEAADSLEEITEEPAEEAADEETSDAEETESIEIPEIADFDTEPQENAPEAVTVETSEESVPEVEEVFTEQENTEVQSDEIDSMLRPESDSEVISDENFDYLQNDENIGKEEDSSDVTIEDPFPPIEAVQEKQMEATPAAVADSIVEQRTINSDLKNDIKSVLLYMDQLLENLPEDKIMEFAKSEQFTTYKRLFNELGLS